MWEILASCRLPDDPFLRSLEAADCVIIWNQVKPHYSVPGQVCEQTFPFMRVFGIYRFVRYTAVGQDNSVGIATRYGQDVSGIESR